MLAMPSSRCTPCLAAKSSHSPISWSKLACVRASERSFSSIDASVPTLAEAFQQSGYATGAFITNPFLAPTVAVQLG